MHTTGVRVDQPIRAAEDAAFCGPRPRNSPRPILVAIPFYKNEHLVQAVVNSLIHCADELRTLGAEVVLYNDSPDYLALDAALTEILPAALAAFPCRIERNPSNLGFVRTMNRAIDEAIVRRFDLLLLNSDTMVEPGALTEMARVSLLDPMIGFVNPRSNNAAIATLPVAVRFKGKPPSREAYQTLAAMLPEFRYVPTAVGFCMLIRWNILAAFGGFDEIYGAGYNEENDLVMRAARCGYRAVFANHAFVWHESEQSFAVADFSKEHWEPTNRAILDRRYPEYGAYTVTHDSAPETIAEQLLAALVPDAEGRLDFAFDFSSFAPAHNGTFHHGLQLVTVAREVLGDRFNIYALCSPETFEFFGYDRWGVELRDPHGPEKFAFIFRLGQPYDWNTIERLSLKGAVIGTYMLDTISIDCPQLASARLFNLWQFAIEQSDMIAAVSAMTLAQLRTRFQIPERIVVETALQSLDIEDYRLPGTGRDASGAGTLLVLGNHYQHKYLAPTANALATAFPDRTVVALGQSKPLKEIKPEGYEPQHLSHAPNLLAVPVGKLEESEIGEFYAGADAIVFPTHYEGFGMPLLHALAANRPIFVRSMPVFEEIWSAQNRNPNIHFYETTDELIGKLRDIPKWTPAPAHRGSGISRQLGQIRDALLAARERLTFERIVSRLRAVQFVNDAGGFTRLQTPAMAKRNQPRIGSVLHPEGVEFVRNAYLAVLGREPDGDGLSHFVDRLKGKGRAEKIAILNTLVKSEEGRAIGAHLPGLRIRTAYFRLRRIAGVDPR